MHVISCSAHAGDIYLATLPCSLDTIVPGRHAAATFCELSSIGVSNENQVQGSDHMAETERFTRPFSQHCLIRAQCAWHIQIQGLGQSEFRYIGLNSLELEADLDRMGGKGACIKGSE